MSHNSLPERLWLWVPPLVYMAAIFHFSSESNPLPEVTTRVSDTILHAIEYAGLAVLLCRALVGEGLGWLASVVLALAATSVYGASDEWHQAFVPLRSSDVHDWMADIIGGAAGVAIYSVVGPREPSSTASRQLRQPRR